MITTENEREALCGRPIVPMPRSRLPGSPGNPGPGRMSQRQLGDPAAGSIETDTLPKADWGKLRNYLIVAPDDFPPLKFLG